MTTHGMSNTLLYQAWLSIRQRCYNPKNPAYKNYGGRGIKLWGPWHKYAVFHAYVETKLGPKPTRFHTLDRKNNNLGYEPGNLQWATREEQSGNRRDRKTYEIRGVLRSIPEWSKIYGADKRTVYNRISLGWEIERALLEVPVKGRNQFGIPERKS